MGYLRSLVVLVVFLPIFSTAGEKKKAPSLEDDLDLLQGRWVQVKPDGKLKVTLVFGHKQGKDAIKNYLIVAETAMNKGKEEIEGGSFGGIGLHEADNKRTFSYKKGKGGDIGYKFSDGKLILEGDYATADVNRKLSGEWKKLDEPVAVADVGKSLLGTWWERKGAKEDPKIFLQFRATKDNKGIELGTWPHWKKDKGEATGHFAKVNLQEKEAPGLAAIPLQSRPIWARVLMPRLFFTRLNQPIYLEMKDGKLLLEGEYEYKGMKYTMSGEWTKVEKK
jgi:hypothetical protein